MIDGASLAGVGIFISAVVGFFVYRLQSRSTHDGAHHGMIGDALALRAAAQEAYEEARREIDEVRHEGETLRKEMDSLRSEFKYLQQEVEHWRRVAFHAREQYIVEVGRDPFWWAPFTPQEGKA